MTAAVIAAGAALVGLLIGFFVRWGEFRREQRFAVYTSFLSAFLDVMERGSGTAGAGTQPADLLRRFEVEALRARMVRTRHVSPLLAEAEAIVDDGGAPVPGEEEGAAPDAGSGRQVRALELARRIADEARRDVSGFGLPF